jgi:hypothetical protein
VRDELFSLWSSARSQMPEDVIKKALGVVTEHKETLRGKEVHIWYPENDKGTEGMLRVLNSGYDNAKSYNFDSEPADTSHDNLYRFHDRKFVHLVIPRSHSRRFVVSLSSCQIISTSLRRCFTNSPPQIRRVE